MYASAVGLAFLGTSNERDCDCESHAHLKIQGSQGKDAVLDFPGVLIISALFPHFIERHLAPASLPPSPRRHPLANVRLIFNFGFPRPPRNTPPAIPCSRLARQLVAVAWPTVSVYLP